MSAERIPVNVSLRLTEHEIDLIRRIADDLVVAQSWVMRRAIARYLTELEAGLDIAEALSFDVTSSRDKQKGNVDG